MQKEKHKKHHWNGSQSKTNVSFIDLNCFCYFVGAFARSLLIELAYLQEFNTTPALLKQQGPLSLTYTSQWCEYVLFLNAHLFYIFIEFQYALAGLVRWLFGKTLEATKFIGCPIGSPCSYMAQGYPRVSKGWLWLIGSLALQIFDDFEAGHYSFTQDKLLVSTTLILLVEHAVSPEANSSQELL